jgi:hypothetical protein
LKIEYEKPLVDHITADLSKINITRDGIGHPNDVVGPRAPP